MKHVSTTDPLLRRASSRVAMAVAVVAALAARPGLTQAQPDVARSRAAEHYKQGVVYFQRGEHDRALAEYQAAFDLSAEPSLVFNIALCHDRAGRPEEAVAAYRRYLALAPEGDVAGEAREEVARLTILIERERAARAAAEARRRELEALRPPPAPPPPPPPRAPRYLIAGGSALVAAGGVVHVLAWRARGRAEDAADPDTYYRERDALRARRTAAIALYAVGAATAATGLVLAAALGRERRPTLAAAPIDGGAVVTVGWSR